MNANQLINMVIRIVMRQVIGRGVRAGMDAASNKLAKRGGDSDADRQQEMAARDTAKRATKALRAGKRINKF